MIASLYAYFVSEENRSPSWKVFKTKVKENYSVGHVNNEIIMAGGRAHQRKGCIELLFLNETSTLVVNATVALLLISLATDTVRSLN